jgi:predicted nucleotide-binding protein
MIKAVPRGGYFHVRLTVKGERHDEVKLDLEEAELEDQFLAPYRRGTPITVNGRTIPIERLERIKISASTEPSVAIINNLKAADAESPAILLGGPGFPWRAAARALDVTDQFITGPPGERADAHLATSTAADPDSVPNLETEGHRVFLVAGRDNVAIDAIKMLLRCLGLEIVEWEHAVAKTGLPNPYVGDVVRAGFDLADAAVVLFTPDDIVRLRSDLIRDEDGPGEQLPRGQARPNVYYEAGIADQIGRNRTVIIEVGPVKPFSDASGRLVIRYDGSPAMRNSIAERLKVAGVTVNTSGSDWLTAGDIGDAIAIAGEAVEAASEADL